MKGAIIGKKIGMTSFYTDDGKHIPCTVVEAGPCPVVQIKTPETDGVSALQIGFAEQKENRINKPMKGHFKKADVKPQKHLREFRDLEGEYELGQNLTVEQFAKGDIVNISGNSRGKGFQGVMKRHNFSGVGMMSHGQSDRQRHPGSIGQSSYPSRVIKGLKMGGRMGGKRLTVRNLEIVEVIPDQNLLIIKGSVPGAPETLLEIVKQAG